MLENVRTFTAAADLDIGPHTLSALRFQSTSLNTNSIVYSGNSGVLTTSDKFTYTKGVLAAPAMKVENLLCALDARGNDIRYVCHMFFVFFCIVLDEMFIYWWYVILFRTDLLTKPVFASVQTFHITQFIHFLSIYCFFSNALLTNAKLAGASISATDVTIPGMFVFAI